VFSETAIPLEAIQILPAVKGTQGKPFLMKRAILNFRSAGADIMNSIFAVQ